MRARATIMGIVLAGYRPVVQPWQHRWGPPTRRSAGPCPATWSSRRPDPDAPGMGPRVRELQLNRYVLSGDRGAAAGAWRCTRWRAAAGWSAAGGCGGRSPRGPPSGSCSATRARSSWNARCSRASRPEPPGRDGPARRRARGGGADGPYSRTGGASTLPGRRRSRSTVMADLHTRYLGLDLRCPLVASASPLTGSLDGLRRLEAAGAGAVVLPSLFEEQLRLEAEQVRQLLEAGAGSLTATLALDEYNAGPHGYLMLVSKARASLEVPVIASLNGVTPGAWVE